MFRADTSRAHGPGAHFLIATGIDERTQTATPRRNCWKQGDGLCGKIRNNLAKVARLRPFSDASI